MSVRTEHLILRPFTPEQLIALVETPDEFKAVAGFPAAAGLRDFFVSDEVDPAWRASLKTLESGDIWRLGFAVIDVESKSIVGSGGFKGPPGGDRVVEIAYGIVPSFQGRGYGTELARALTEYCFQNDVKRVRAHTLPVENASNRILKKCGFTFIGEVNDPGDGIVWRWERVKDLYDLNRFIEAQALSYDQALAELRLGQKRLHWMWFVFPQIAGLGSSPMSHRYSIKTLDEARAYLDHPILGERLLESARAVLCVENKSATEILGTPDDLKLKSCATLFESVSAPGSVFAQILDKYYDGERDSRTLELIRSREN